MKCKRQQLSQGKDSFIHDVSAAPELRCVTTYRNLKVVTRREGHYPLIIGPLLISQTKTAESYDYFFGKLTSLNKNIKNILAIVTDGEEASISAMKNSKCYAFHLRCFGRRELRKLKTVNYS